MISKRTRPREEHPELTPYAPPQHPEVSVPGQQFDAYRTIRWKPIQKPATRPN
jgi:hypothetical protein